LCNSTWISKNTHTYPNALTSQNDYIYFYYYNFAYVDHFTFDANCGYYLYFYLYAYYSSNNAYLSMTNSVFNVDARYPVQPSKDTIILICIIICSFMPTSTMLPGISTQPIIQ